MKTIHVPGVGAWVALVLATALSWGLGTEAGGAATSVVVLVVAFAKVRLVGRHFMELRDAPTLVRGAFDAYLAMTLGLVLGFYLWG